MDNWNELRKRLKESIEVDNKMSYYEYMYSKHIGAKEVLELMDKIEAEKDTIRTKSRVDSVMKYNSKYPEDYRY